MHNHKSLFYCICKSNFYNPYKALARHCSREETRTKVLLSSFLVRKMAKICFWFCVVVGLVTLGFCHGSRATGDGVGVYELKKGDFSVKLTNWGATIISVVLPDKNGKLDDVVLGFDSVEDYKNDSSYYGAIVGRVANRIGGAQFTLNGTHYKLAHNDGRNTLHGGRRGFSDVIWKVRKYKNEGHAPHIIFSYHSSDGEEGFPGDLLVTVGYTLIGNNQLSINMKAKALNKPTPVNLAQHTYWNLGGHKSGNILSEEVQIFGSHITALDKELIPTGKIIPVKGTPYDFLRPHTIASTFYKLPNGYDINYILDGGVKHKMKRAAIVHDKRSGRVMDLWTTAPGVQFYTSNMMKDTRGKGGYVYKRLAALCLETQGFPDAVNHPNFLRSLFPQGRIIGIICSLSFRLLHHLSSCSLKTLVFFGPFTFCFSFVF